MKMFSKFNTAYKLVMEQIESANLSDAIKKLKNDYNNHVNFKEANEADPTAMQAAYKSAINKTKKAYDAALDQDTDIEVFCPYNWRSGTVKIISPTKAPGRTGKFYRMSSRSLAPDTYCFLFNDDNAKVYPIYTFILKSEHNKLIALAETCASNCNG